MAEQNKPRPEWAGRRSGNLELQDRMVLKLSMLDIYGNGADCVAWAVFGRRLSPAEIRALLERLRACKQQLLSPTETDTSDWDELTAVEKAVAGFSEDHNIPYALSTDYVSAELTF